MQPPIPVLPPCSTILSPRHRGVELASTTGLLTLWLRYWRCVRDPNLEDGVRRYCLEVASEILEVLRERTVQAVTS
jgi:hypothetical protein